MFASDTTEILAFQRVAGNVIRQRHGTRLRGFPP
jgi:hypothetical protein